MPSGIFLAIFSICRVKPRDIVTLRVADNSLMQEQLRVRMNTNFDLAPRYLLLNDTITGSVGLKAAIAHFLSHYSTRQRHPSHWISLPPMDFDSVDPIGVSAVSKYEEAIMLCSPHNPLGGYYSWLIDPNQVHMLWGLSNGFGSNGVPLGVIISQGNYCLTTSVLEDKHLVDRYIMKNYKQLAAAYTYVVPFLHDHGIPYTQVAYCSPDEDESARWNRSWELADKLALHKAHFGIGADFGSEQPGWFRITFSQHRDQLDEGLKRILQDLYSWIRYNK
ncbi:hypothetical protein BDV23DRAFT_174129 [Aspergillus alliaceus]|uniref:Pyridoxal phosphate-dependent transferase n=1 Tax=Petromyces alliaceus TaxID=209559 RepID=A0A5N7C2T4_PETAA|nr:hypothetical protein BDV23DRAFT_174129 [Aspergillus alliaceus]